jgi:hypothetical protein
MLEIEEKKVKFVCNFTVKSLPVTGKKQPG